jgi:signal transduction histidine kinase
MRSIKQKLIFSIAILFIFIGIGIYLALLIVLHKEVPLRTLRQDAKIAQYITHQIIEPVLFNDALSLSLLLHDGLSDLEDAQYLFIQSPDGKITAHTFAKGFPRGLIALNTGRIHYSYKVKEFLADGVKLYDIAVPILNGKLGNLHLGVSLKSSRTVISKFSNIITVIIFTGLGAGILLFTVLGIVLSNRIIKIKNFALAIGRGNLNDKIDIKAKDELGSLAASLNEMVVNLKEKIEKIRKLSYLEERERIALEFHDGLAQNLANIIKRLELCEKLFKSEPGKVFEELDILRENTKDILDKTRQMISGLKSSEDIDFNLLDNLTKYIKDYQRYNDINVKLEVLGSVNNITAEIAKTIFYIITEALTNIRKHSQAKNVGLSLNSSSSKTRK